MSTSLTLSPSVYIRGRYSGQCNSSNNCTRRPHTMTPSPSPTPQSVITRLDYFMLRFGKLLANNDRETIAEIRQGLVDLAAKQMVVNVHGHHYTDCPWSHESCTCGPDRCPCSIRNVPVFSARLDNITNFYTLLYERITCDGGADNHNV